MMTLSSTRAESQPEVNIGLPQQMLKGDVPRLRSLAFDPTASQIAAVNEVGTLRVWQL